MANSIVKIILTKVIGFVIFLVVLGIANLLIPRVPNEVYGSVVNFFNTNLLLFVFLIFLGLLNEIFWTFYFPFNVIAPISGAVLGIYITIFLYKFWNFIDGYVVSGIVVPIDSIKALVGALTLIVGYVLILVRGGKPKEVSDAEWKRWQQERLKKKKNYFEKKIEKIDRKLGKKRLDWDDVGYEFKKFFYNIGKGLNGLFERKKK